MQPSQTYGGVSHQQPNVARLLAIVPGREEETDDLLPDDPNVRSVVHHPIFSLLPDPALRSQKKSGSLFDGFSLLPDKSFAGPRSGSAPASASAAHDQHFGFGSEMFVAPDEEGGGRGIIVSCLVLHEPSNGQQALEVQFYALKEDDARGKAIVRILKYHKIEGDAPISFLRKVRRWDFRNDFQVVRTTPIRLEQFKEDLNASKDQDSLLFIHGYNVDFESAAIRAAQLGFDLMVPGITAFFSWPAQGTGSGKVHIIAHSMGNRGLLRALQRIRQMPETGDVSFGQVIFAAPDEDRDVFCDTVEELVRPAGQTQLATRFTLHASKHDNAVWTSALLHQAPRAGFWLPYTEANGLDSIATDVAGDFLGHSYYANAIPVLRGIKSLVSENKDPSQRGLFGLRTVGPFQNVWHLGKKN